MSKQKFSTAAVDRIGSLPDEILIHILSFVPTKQAVATSILSKRWIHLWRYVPDVKFIETKLEPASCFNEFVCSVLRSRVAAGNHSINSFILDVKYDSSELLLRSLDNIEEWVSDVVKRNVQYLNLRHQAPRDWDWKGAKPPKLPTSIITCTTLVVLKLCGFSFIGAHSLLNFPSLKTLHLKDIYFDLRHEFTLLLDGCPVLEDLQQYNIHFNRLSSHFYKQLSSSSLRRLNRADITACDCYFLVKSLSNLEFLRIKLYKDYHPYYYDFPTFDNLTHLVLNYDWNIVVRVLHHCPKLQNLDLYQKLQGDNRKNKYITRDYIPNWADPKSVPSCLSSNLTTCTMRDFALFGLQRNHIVLARFILENARVLETMSIWCYRKRSKVERVLSSCPRAAATCQLSIYWW